MRKYEYLGIIAGLIVFAAGWYLVTSLFGHQAQMHHRGETYDAAPAPAPE